MMKKPLPPSWRVLPGSRASGTGEAPAGAPWLATGEEETELTPAQLAEVLLEYVLDQPLGSPYNALLYAAVYWLQGQRPFA